MRGISKNEISRSSCCSTGYLPIQQGDTKQKTALTTRVIQQHNTPQMPACQALFPAPKKLQLFSWHVFTCMVVCGIIQV